MSDDFDADVKLLHPTDSGTIFTIDDVQRGISACCAPSSGCRADTTRLNELVRLRRIVGAARLQR